MSDSQSANGRKNDRPDENLPQGANGGSPPGVETLVEVGADISPLTDKPEAFSASELKRAIFIPLLAIELLLGGKNRLASSVAERKNLLLLSALLLFVSALFPLLYGAIGPIGAITGFWKISALYAGSLVICYPCLCVFSSYLGFRFDALQTFIMAITISCAAGIFTFGFAPIIWFIDFTTSEPSDAPAIISFLLLAFSLLLGVIHMGRSFLWSRSMKRLSEIYPLLMLCWLPLLVFIHYRMAVLLRLVWWSQGSSSAQ